MALGNWACLATTTHKCCSPAGNMVILKGASVTKAEDVARGRSPEGHLATGVWPNKALVSLCPVTQDCSRGNNSKHWKHITLALHKGRKEQSASEQSVATVGHPGATSILRTQANEIKMSSELCSTRPYTAPQATSENSTTGSLSATQCSEVAWLSPFPETEQTIWSQGTAGRNGNKLNW